MSHRSLLARLGCCRRRGCHLLLVLDWHDSLIVEEKRSVQQSLVAHFVVVNFIDFGHGQCQSSRRVGISLGRRMHHILRRLLRRKHISPSMRIRISRTEWIWNFWSICASERNCLISPGISDYLQFWFHWLIMLYFLIRFKQVFSLWISDWRL